MPGTGVEAGASYGDLLVTSLIVLGAVCIAAFIAVRFFGRFLAAGRVKGSHLLDVVARVPLEPRRSLYVVEVAGKTLLVGTSEMGLSVLSELDGHEVKSRAVPTQSFADLVRGAWSRRKGLAAEARREGGSSDVSVGSREQTSSVANVDATESAGSSANGDVAESPGSSATVDKHKSGSVDATESPTSSSILDPTGARSSTGAGSSRDSTANTGTGNTGG